MVKSVPTWLRALKNLDVSAARTVDGWKLMYVYKSHVLLYLALYIGCSSKQTNKQTNKQKNSGLGMRLAYYALL